MGNFKATMYYIINISRDRRISNAVASYTEALRLAELAQKSMNNGCTYGVEEVDWERNERIKIHTLGGRK